MTSQRFAFARAPKIDRTMVASWIVGVGLWLTAIVVLSIQRV